MAARDRPHPATPLDAALFCPRCGYDLRGQGDTVPACSECGQALDAESLQAMQVPWQARREIGPRRALLKTAWRVAANPQRLCLAAAFDVDDRDALRFRRWVVALLTLLWLLACGVGLFAVSGEQLPDISNLQQDTLLLVLAALGGCLVLVTPIWLYVASGVHVYLFSIGMQDAGPAWRSRVMALSRYAAGLMLFTPIPLGLFAAGAAIAAWSESWQSVDVGLAETIYLTGIAATIIGVAMTVGLALAAVRVLTVMQMRLMQRGPVTALVLTLLVPVAWMLLAVWLAGLAASVLYLALMVYTSVW